MQTELRRFRIVLKNRPHPTDSLTMRCFDLLALHAEEARSLCQGRYPRRHVVVRDVSHEPLSQVQREYLLQRLQRYRAEAR